MTSSAAMQETMEEVSQQNQEACGLVHLSLSLSPPYPLFTQRFGFIFVVINQSSSRFIHTILITTSNIDQYHFY